jgi:hypothetical protein
VKKARRVGEMSDEQADDTSIPFADEKYIRDFLEGRVSSIGQVDFPLHLQTVVAEINRRLVRQQAKLLETQNTLLESQEKVAKSLKRATWVLSFATVALVLATLVPVLAKL